MSDRFYITTAIDYTNSPPHIGHAYEKILADVLARYHRLKGNEVFFLTGVDQHGQKVQQSAEKQGIAPEKFVAQITETFRALWKRLDVRYDRWAATTEPLHKKCVQGMLQRLWNEKQIYKDKRAGYYSVRQEQFLTDKERGPDGEFGPEWGQVEFREEENYYFRLSDHKEWLLTFLRSHPDFVTPNFRQTELVNAVEKLAGDLCISRPKSRLSWGIELPFDHDFVNYVWFDALTNYISFIAYDATTTDFGAQPAEFRKWWPALHVIGKDIMAPAHGIYWPIMLHALGFPDKQMPKLLVHGWWNVSGAKMSKSLGNVVDPVALAEKYGVEALRYYLMIDVAAGSDADFAENRLIERYNSDLANSLGNLLNRTLAMIERYSNKRIDKCFEADSFFRQPDGWWNSPGATNDGYGGQRADLAARLRTVSGLVDVFRQDLPNALKQFRVHDILGRLIHLNDANNAMLEIGAPWKLQKDSGRKADLAAILYHAAESLRIIAILISPVLPRPAHGIFDQLNWRMELSGKEGRFSLADLEWGRLPDGHIVGKPTPLFPRIER